MGAKIISEFLNNNSARVPSSVNTSPPTSLLPRVGRRRCTWNPRSHALVEKDRHRLYFCSRDGSSPILRGHVCCLFLAVFEKF